MSHGPERPQEKPFDAKPGCVKPSRFVRLGSVVAAIGFALFVVEGLLQLLLGNIGMPRYVIGPPDGRCAGLQPGTAVEYTGWSWRIPPVTHDVNRFGFRGVPRERAKPPGMFRILVVGDSYVYGQAVEADQTMTVHMERHLSGVLGRPVEVLNFGIPGLNLEENVEQYRRFAAGWEHDLVLFAADNNDLSVPICDTVDHPVLMRLVRHVRLARLAYFLHLGFVHERYLQSASPMERIEQAFEAFLDTSRSAGARLGVFLVHGTTLEGAPQGVLETAASERDVPFFVLQPDPTGGNKTSIDRIPEDLHFSDAGNQEAALRVSRWLAEVGLLPPPAG